MNSKLMLLEKKKKKIEKQIKYHKKTVGLSRKTKKELTITFGEEVLSMGLLYSEKDYYGFQGFVAMNLSVLEFKNIKEVSKQKLENIKKQKGYKEYFKDVFRWGKIFMKLNFSKKDLNKIRYLVYSYKFLSKEKKEEYYQLKKNLSI
ncbi:hypothetical protein [Fusobacterium necrophorum]|uniref:Uncharacterized protein n=1 Tax=Fusobacterium necrophorum TaxID=859 RepID=A0A4Q2KXY1_9FUSO|nr:hypothetical protein [Fusobacterium necrophorum]RXZ68431.1 hypothetical protein EPT53_09910 [Fusobacterium necrophorum]